MSNSLFTNETSELALLDQCPFEQTDFEILKSYEAVVDGLAMLTGSQIMSTWVPPETQAQEVPSSVNSSSSIEDLVMQTLEFTIKEVNADRNVSNNAKNRQIVLNLYEKGIFDIKDTINQVADRLNISKHTVYLYIRQFKNGSFLGQNK